MSGERYVYKDNCSTNISDTRFPGNEHSKCWEKVSRFTEITYNEAFKKIETTSDKFQ